MCGIVGFSTNKANIDLLQSDIVTAARSLRHRGPDDEGIWFGEGVGLGHRRLSILDLSHGSHQPMQSPDGRYVIVYNGEVYNFRELRKDLEAEGRRFSTSGDTEVVLAALASWGVETAVRRFIGMFAIALWDNAEKRLILIRDRLGVKPLYYGWDGKTLCFGSELKALRAYRHWQPEIDQTALAEYFQFGYINAPRSIYRNVFKLPPGHWLEFRQGGAPVARRYWSVLDVLGEPLSGSEDELAEQLEALMVDAFRLRMVSDVPVGVFLSGGIDSSVVTALLQKHHGNVHTFTIGFNEARYNEAPHARRIAEYLGTNHTERILETEEAKRILPQWGHLYDEPFADSSGIPTYLVSKIAGEQVKVVLSADGGDELFSGYNNYKNVLALLAHRDRFPKALRALLVTALKIAPLDTFDAMLLGAPIPRSVRDGLRHKVIRRSRLARDTYLNDLSPGAIYEVTMSPYWRELSSGLLLSVSSEMAHIGDPFAPFPGAIAEKMCLWDLHNYLPGDILTKVDRATMAASIEGREPLIDHRLVEFAFRLPLPMRRGVLGPKHLLRKVLYKHIPREMVDRPKMGFGIPLLEWLRGDLGYLLDEYLDPHVIKNQGILCPAVVEKTVRAFKTNDAEVTNKIWSLLAFQMWHQAWMQ